MLQTPYDVMMIVWGLIFVLLWVGFLAAMNHLFQNEEHEWEERDRALEASSGMSPQQPFHPAA